MIEIRSILLPKLTAALSAATGRKIYDGLPIQLFGTAIYPCINISDILVEEDGTKTAFHYKANVLIEVVHKGLHSSSVLYDDMNKVMSILNNVVPFELDEPYKIMDCQLNTSTTTKATTEKGLVDIGIIRIIFRIQ